MIFNLDDIKDKERLKREVKDEIFEKLSYTVFKEVNFVVSIEEKHDSKINMMRQILKNEGCRFYAKLTEDDNIYIVVKYKHDEEVYSTCIENVIYFDSNFKLEK